jgi:cytochrome b pre-mRNA-processing protein 3
MNWRRFLPSPHDRSIGALYGAIVAQARAPAFYQAYGVADTLDGRFDLIVLHLVLVLARLARDGVSARGMGQKLFDAFCRDMDGNLREMGVGDLAVPKRMRRFGEAFYGRQAAYGAAFAAADARELEMALARNIFAETPNDHRPVLLARYARAALQQLAAQPDSALQAGAVSFPDAEAFAHEPANRQWAQQPPTREPASHEPASHEPASHEPASHEPASHEPANHEPA